MKIDLSQDYHTHEIIGGDTINPSQNPAIGISGDSRTGFQTVPVCIEHSKPVGIRGAQYPDGRTVLQAAYRWEEGLHGGVIWRDIPMVRVDENGEEIADA